MDTAERRLQELDGAATGIPSTAYETPRVVELGQTNDLIRGNWTSGVWDSLQGSLQWYVGGE
jgi:hypothetical protein